MVRYLSLFGNKADISFRAHLLPFPTLIPPCLRRPIGATTCATGKIPVEFGVVSKRHGTEYLYDCSLFLKSIFRCVVLPPAVLFPPSSGEILFPVCFRLLLFFLYFFLFFAFFMLFLFLSVGADNLSPRLRIFFKVSVC